MIVFAAFASGRRARVSTTSAFGTALELCIVLVGAAHRVCRHARVAAALLVAGAVGGITIVGAGLQHALGNQFCHPLRHGRFGGCLWRVLLDGARHRCEQNLSWADGLRSHRVLVAIVRTADAAFASARVAAARAACSACEAITVLVRAASSALSHAHITAARRVNSASEVNPVRISTRVAELILAECVCGDRVLVTGTICAAATAGCGAGVSAARAILIALEMHSVLVCAAFRVHWYA